ncbi:MAG: hypothetical protein R2844_09100 [Caldilineales bacterium]
MAEHQPDVPRRTCKWLLIEDCIIRTVRQDGNGLHHGFVHAAVRPAQARLVGRDADLSGIDKRLLAVPSPSGTPLGEITLAAAEATGLPAGTPVVLGGHDYLCGALPVGAIRPGVILDVSRTWEIVMASTCGTILTPGNAGVTVGP